MEAQKNEHITPPAADHEGGTPVVEQETKTDRHAAVAVIAKEARATGSSARVKTAKNDLRKLRMDRMLSKAELARRAGVSTLTIDRVERGLPCRMDTKRKILEALGLTPDDRAKVFGHDDD